MSRCLSLTSSGQPGQRIYLDHAATTPLHHAARAAMMEGLANWANPSSPHAEGRAARAALEEARSRIAQALGWDGHLIFTSGASEAIGIALGGSMRGRLVTSPVEHDSVMRLAATADQLDIDANGRVKQVVGGALHAVQHVNSETGVIQPVDELATLIHERSGKLFCDCAQSAGKIPLPHEADMIAISAHKFGGPPGIGALLVRDLALLRPTGGQEQGYRGGTENLPGAVAMAAALEQDSAWMTGAARLRALLDAEVVACGGVVVAQEAERIPTIAGYRMPGVSARAQLIRFDMAGVAVSAGSACSSGTLKTSPVLRAIGWDDKAADEVIRVSFGPQTREAEVRAFLAVWNEISGRAAA
jgi:cysteine desulfurase